MVADSAERESCVLPNSPAAPALARRFVGSVLAGWALADTFDDAPLVASELVTNAVRHAGGEVAVSISHGDSSLRVAVSDDSETVPVITALEYARRGGWGLNIVERLSAAWGLETSPRGKTVWCELAGHPAGWRSSRTG